MSLHNKQIFAIKLSIESLTRERRKLHAAGEHAYQHGIRSVEINSNGIEGTEFLFAEDGHAGYIEYTNAIQELEDLIEVLTDPGVTHDQPRLFI